MVPRVVAAFLSWGARASRSRYAPESFAHLADPVRRGLLALAPLVLVACASAPDPHRPPSPGDRFRRVRLGRLDARARHLGPIVPIFRAALLEALARTRGVIEARDENGGLRPEDAVLLRGELADDARPFVAVALFAQSRALAGRFELLDAQDRVVQRFVALQRYAPGSGPVFGARGLFDLAVELAATVAAAVGRWLEGGAAALPADTRGRNSEALTRAS
ncbi:MAG: hypothetical protein N2038_00425 [Geminicoccaceae bacterium]|nr:hypothetical protein [Geminicoccaceae bacterium]MCS7267682.1 hypothetical protein [Geminicoccaceae bacterium]MCX7628696.1 hypothetical protein [Geminicoccaceae bacterium]MDW8123525.1 hypothetical protein [Geminicoccaceae bacterium]MDW8339866.1 hypothetical protein [Geminicoccaceae bacterium]